MDKMQEMKYLSRSYLISLINHNKIDELTFLLSHWLPIFVSANIDAVHELEVLDHISPQLAAFHHLEKQNDNGFISSEFYHTERKKVIHTFTKLINSLTDDFYQFCNEIIKKDRAIAENLDLDEKEQGVYLSQLIQNGEYYESVEQRYKSIREIYNNDYSIFVVKEAPLLAYQQLLRNLDIAFHKLCNKIRKEEQFKFDQALKILEMEKREEITLNDLEKQYFKLTLAYVHATQATTSNIREWTNDSINKIDEAYEVAYKIIVRNHLFDEFWNKNLVLVKGDMYLLMSSVNGPKRLEISDYYLDKHIVTVADYRLFCEATGRTMPDMPFGSGSDDEPIVNVSYTDAYHFAKWSGRRLPTDAEWEFAANGGTHAQNTRYAGGNNPDEIGWFRGNSENRLHPVGQKQPNILGLYDMCGNVWEWCDEWYIVEYKNHEKFTNKYRVLHGGAWSSASDSISIHTCENMEAQERNFVTGFRCAKNA